MSDSDEEQTLQVHYEIFARRGRFPLHFRYLLTITADGEDSGVEVLVWGKRRARKIGVAMLETANELINDLGLAPALGRKILAKRAADAAVKEVQAMRVNDTVRLLVDIGPYKRGRVMKVTEVAEVTAYKARGGASNWDDQFYPIRVVPVSVYPDEPVLSKDDGIPLSAEEFCPGDKEVE